MATEMKVLIVVGHPRPGSLSEAIAEAYREGADHAAVQTRMISLASLAFDLNVRTPSPRGQPLEPDLEQAQQAITWADHLVFVYPTWWGTMPALMKGFLDRTLVPGHAFVECEGGTGFEPRLRGKTAELITTMDTPRWVYRWILGSPGHRAMRLATLGFCGIDVVRTTSFGPVKGSTPAQRKAWLDHARGNGRRLRRGAVSWRQRRLRRAIDWVRALRLQFYPMTWGAYTVGALAASRMAGEAFDMRIYLGGYLVLFFLEAATVFSNEYFDYESDRQNRYYSTFTGGSRVLVEGRLTPGDLRSGIAVSLLLCAICVAAVLAITPSLVIALLLAMLMIAALGYTIPPLRLAYRGWGELDVSATHSIGVLLVGFVLQGGSWSDPVPWLISAPLFLSVMPAIVLAGIPDAEADRAVGKGTLVVRLGSRRAIKLAMVLTIASAALVVAYSFVEVTGELFSGAVWGVIPHALLLTGMLWRRLQASAARPRIDRLIAVALAYILWFVVIPLIHLV